MVAHVRPSCCWLLLGCRPTADELQAFLFGGQHVHICGWKWHGAATHQCLLAALPPHIVGACAMQRMRRRPGATKVCFQQGGMRAWLPTHTQAS
jgi:hypothetical protein